MVNPAMFGNICLHSALINLLFIVNKHKSIITRGLIILSSVVEKEV